MFFFFSSRRRHTRYWRDWSSDVCSSDLQHSIEYLAGLLLIGEGLVRRYRSSQQRQRIEDRGLVILRVSEIELLHGFLISERAGSVIELLGIFIENLDRRDVILLPLRASSHDDCFLHCGRSVL